MVQLTIVFQITMIQSKKRHEVLGCLASVVRAYGDFFNEGAHLMKRIEPDTDAIVESISEMKKASTALEKDLEKRHALISPGIKLIFYQHLKDTSRFTLHEIVSLRSKHLFYIEIIY